MSITQRDLAAMFDVSQMTVSRALRGSKLVKEELRRTIVEAAKKHGYSPERNYAARVLRMQSTDRNHRANVICAMMPDEAHDELFWSRMRRGICNAANKAGNEVIAPVSYRENELPLVVQRQQVDGVVWAAGKPRLLAEQGASPVPWVSVMYEVEGVDVVRVNDKAGGEQLGKHLAQLGHRRVGFIGPDTELARDRLTGLTSAIERVGGTVPGAFTFLSELITGGDLNAAAPIDKLLETQRQSKPDQRVTAIMAYNDFVAVHIITHLGQHGLSVPDDLSIVGFDGAMPRGYQGPDITSAAIPLEELGSEAARLLSWRIEHPHAPHRQVVLPTELHIGRSTRAVAASFST